jgi:hypothetical protein
MAESKEGYYSITDMVKFFKSFVRYITGNWWLLLLAAVIGGVLGLMYYKFMQKPKYEAVCTFILEEKDNALGGIGGIASQFGLDMGSMGGGGNIFAGDNILEILKSRNIIQNVLLSKIDSNGVTKDQTLADLFLEFSGWKAGWSSNAKLKDLTFGGIKKNKLLSLEQDSVLHLIHQHLIKNSISTERLNKKGSIIKVTFTAADQRFAKLMSDRVIDESRSFYINIKTNTSLQNVIRLERQSDSLLALLNNKTYQAASAVVLDANPAFRTLNVPSELKMRDKTVLGTIYSEVVKNLELSRMALNQQTPVIQILDQPSFPLVDRKKSMPFLMFTLALIFALIITMVLVIRFFLVVGKRE